MNKVRVFGSAAAVASTMWLLMACQDPLYTLPGGELRGTVQSFPDSWSDSRAIETVQVQTNPTDPYSVNVWGVDIGEQFFVAASGGRDSRWARHILADPDVVLRLGDNLYALRAARVEDSEQLAEVANRFAEKYDIDPGDNFVDEAWVFRLDPRP